MCSHPQAFEIRLQYARLLISKPAHVSISPTAPKSTTAAASDAFIRARLLNHACPWHSWDYAYHGITRIIRTICINGMWFERLALYISGNLPVPDFQFISKYR